MIYLLNIGASSNQSKKSILTTHQKAILHMTVLDEYVLSYGVS